MESMTIEIAVAEGDPFDRTLSILVKSGQNMMLARSLRVSPDVRIGEVLLNIDRLVLAWALPQVAESEHLHDTWDSIEERISTPFAP